MSDTIELPPPDLDTSAAFVTTLVRRRSMREFGDRALDWPAIGQLAWAAQGITDRQRALRSAPSAGALFPLELDLVLPDGLFRYHASHHRLRRRESRDLRRALAHAALRQGWIADAACVFVLSAVLERTAGKYGSRAPRYVQIEAGHAAQNLLLQAVALELAATPVGAFDDAEITRVLALAANEAPLYLLPVGHAGA